MQSKAGRQAYLDLLASSSIDDGVTLADSAAVDAHVGELPKSTLL